MDDRDKTNDTNSNNYNENEKGFAEAVKKMAEDEPAADFFKGMDENIPHYSTYTAKQEPTKKYRKRALYSVVAAAACVCIVFVTMFANGVGLFSQQNMSSSSDIAVSSASGIDAVEWATAGEGYKDLYTSIKDSASSAAATGNIVMEAAEELPGVAPEATAAPSAGAGDAAADSPVLDTLGGEGGTAGSGYEDSSIPFPTDESDTDSGLVIDDSDGTRTEDETAGNEENESSEQDGEVEGSLDEEVVEEEVEVPNEYSDTNEQVAGVREADVVKTDGDYIYAINSNNLIIVKADDGELSLASKIPQPSVDEGQVYFEMYVAGDRLIAIRQGYNPIALLRSEGMDEDSIASESSIATCIAYPIGGWFTDTSVDIFDISDRSNPTKIHSLSQSGGYNTSRMIDGYLYLITNYYGDPSQAEEGDPRTFVPLYAQDDEQLTPEPDDIILPPGEVWPSYTVIGGIDAMGGGDFVSQKSVYGEAGTVYMSQSAVYLARADWTQTESRESQYIKYSGQSTTVLTKLTLESGVVEPFAQARVNGTTLNQFSLDEYKGVLRLVTTDDRNTWYGFTDNSVYRSEAEWAAVPAGENISTNALYTLDANLKLMGSVSELAPSERVYSCRFMGDIAYFVTFRQTDPLFSVDVSDPNNPKVLGALKIPGFSEYLHPYSDGRLFGLGRDADEQTGLQQGLKLTMFDNSNPSDVRELHTLVVGDEYSAAEQNHKAILINANKSLIAFPTYDKYLIYGYSDEQGFYKIAEVAFEGDENTWAEIRGLFINDTFYVIGPNSINTYSIDKAFAPAGSLQIDEGASSVNRWSFGTPGIIMPLMEVDVLPEPGADDVVVDSIE